MLETAFLRVGQTVHIAATLMLCLRRLLGFTRDRILHVAEAKLRDGASRQAKEGSPSGTRNFANLRR